MVIGRGGGALVGYRPVRPQRPEAWLEHRGTGSRLGWLDRARATRSGRIVVRVTVGVVGLALVLVGLVLVPLPGPGWLIVLAGLAVLAIEFVWAQHVLRFTRRQLRRWTDWIKRQSWPVRMLVGAAGLIFVGVVVWLSLKYSLDIDLVERGRDWLNGR